MLADTRRPAPDLASMRQLVDALGQPQAAAPVIHVTGTNGKTSTARCVSSLLSAKGLRAGTFTSPHLESINERIASDGEPISDEDLVTVLSEIAAVEPMLGDGVRLSWFEILAGAAMLWFADRPVDIAVLEVGMGGRWDATNVADAGVAVVTNVGMDHVEFLGPTRADIAGEKAGVVKPGATLVLGERDDELRSIFDRQDPAEVWLVGVEYGCTRNDPAVGGRVLDIHTPGATYEGVWLDLHGRHQGENFAAALAACEAFFGGPLDDRLVREAAGTVRSPGRLEIVGRQPLVVLDGAKNLEGAHRAAEAVAEEFGSAASEILVVGMLRGKDPAEMLEALGAHRARLVVACPAPSPRTQPAAVVAEAARSLGVEALEAESVPEALELALSSAGADDLVLVTGSLYVVGAARACLAVGTSHE
ncbi:MAG TPA: folylpolyglutamate synthase/dihydrofolate synthase family protein [Acidimicrobiales bacterium]|nr:folylpolyglutamate synthase/dihydrofolate synthase family protein [Acidimicrobiales bacterium]